MPTFEYDSLVSHLRDRFGDDLRWVASFHSTKYDYDFKHVRKDLQNDLTGNQLDYIVHRSLAVFNRNQVEQVYSHLGDADYLLADYDKGTAFHLFLDDRRGVTIILEPDAAVELPAFVTECREQLEPA